MDTVAVKEKPVIFGPESVKAILAGKKVQTRRVVKPQPDDVRWTPIVLNGHAGWVDEHGYLLKCPYGKPGERLWVREAWTQHDAEGKHHHPFYKADYGLDGGPAHPQWRSPIFMPRAASRIILEVTAVRIERLLSITEEDAIAEGVLPGKFGGWCADEECETLWEDASGAYLELWDRLNANRGFPSDDNPFCWVVTFKRLQP